MSEFHDPFKDVRFEHDGPSDEERAEVAAEIEVEADSVDAAASEGEVEVEGPFESIMAWEGMTDRPLLQQIARIAGLTSFAKQQFGFVVGLEEEGVPDDILPCTITLGSKDEQVLSYALNLVGFFAPEMAEAAHDLAHRVVEAVDAKEIPEEAERLVNEAAEKFQKRAFAAQFGLTVEELDAKIAEEVAREGDEIVGEAEAEAVSPTTDVSWN